jgi:polyphosphate kinase
MKVHAKLCLIKKVAANRIIHYGFVSTGNINERTAKIYGDHCLLTADKNIMADVNRIFHYLELPKMRPHFLNACKTLMVTPVAMRKQLLLLIQKEITAAKKRKPAAITLKLNSLSDEKLIAKLYDAARAGVKVNMILMGIFCMLTQNSKFKEVYAISIVDEYLEHARVMIFHNDGKEKVFISSADWMLRNLDHRIEAACPVFSKNIQQELKDIMQIQLNDNIKARILDNELSNQYVNPRNTKKVRSQLETYNYLYRKSL